MISNLLPPGFKDELFDQSFIEHKYKNIIIGIFQQNGYELVKTPLIEYISSSNKNNSFIIKVKNEKNDYVLRNDITMQIARLSSARLKNKQRPLKLCYYGEVVRKKGTLLRPERQFLQVGAECIGENSYLADVEMLNLAYQSLTAVGIKNITIELSSGTFLDQLLKNNNNIKTNNQIKSFLKKKDFKNSIKFLDSNLHEFAYDLISCSGELSENKILLNKLKTNIETVNAVEELLNIYNNFSNNYPQAKVILDLTEGDYLDYHIGTRFTIFAENVRGEIARGGRYTSTNNLFVEYSTGFNCYMDTVIRASSTIEKLKKVMIPFDTTVDKKNDLINKGYILETFFGNLKQIKEIAEIKKFDACLIKNNIVKLDNK